MTMQVYKFEVQRTRLCEPSARVSGTDMAAELAMSLIGNCDREHLIALYLDAQNNVVGVETIAIGQLEGVAVHPREVFRGAILAGALSIVLAHNHPSGNPTPSIG